MSAVIKFHKHSGKLIRRASKAKQITILKDIYREDTNIVIWQRELSESLKKSIDDFLISDNTFRTEMIVTPDNVVENLSNALGHTKCKEELSENIYELVYKFCLLFKLKKVALRLTTLNYAMCPKFHYDSLPCRLVTTFHGVATEWLPHEKVDRSKLGLGSKGLADHQSGLYQDNKDIQQLSQGDVALLKGELWKGNQNAGLVHRSPNIKNNDRRLLMTLDFVN